MDPVTVANMQRFFGRTRRGTDAEGSGSSERRPARPGAGGYAAIVRERELHAMILAEMERRGPEATAEELYEQVAEEWDRRHGAPASERPDEPAGSTAPAARGFDPSSLDAGSLEAGWVAQLLEEQRTTNLLLARVIELLERRAQAGG